MAPKPLPTQEMLLSRLAYDPERGELRWRRRTPDQFAGIAKAAETECVRWNTRYADQLALNNIAGSGYRAGKFLGQPVLAHRVIWKLMTGEEPPEIDHDDGNKANNRWSNLQASTHTENMKNKQRYRSNSSGCAGVQWHKQHRKWVAGIGRGSTYQFLGLFDHLDDAIRARKSAERKAGYHRNHGRNGNAAPPSA